MVLPIGVTAGTRLTPTLIARHFATSAAPGLVPLALGGGQPRDRVPGAVADLRPLAGARHRLLRLHRPPSQHHCVGQLWVRVDCGHSLFFFFFFFFLLLLL